MMHVRCLYFLLKKTALYFCKDVCLRGIYRQKLFEPMIL